MHFPLSVPLGPSRAVMASILAAHAVAGLALFHVPGLMPSGEPWSRLQLLGVALGLALPLSLFHALARERAKRGWVLVLGGEGGLSVQCCADGDAAAIHDYRLAPGAVDFGWAVWLPLVGPVAESGASPERLQRRLMLLRANMAPVHWRLLRMWLRHKAAPLAGA
ncbi:protein YgfX [Thauera butanivorans]|uniref:protein YgfX n=1 Tax=Thauera butanivorans TaxID=86174 RepID=UPI0008388CFC